MSLYFTVTKRRIIFLILIMLLIAITVAEFLNVGNYKFNASTAKARLEFAERVGCEIKDKNNFTIRTVNIPQEFSQTYTDYNMLQRSQGFDLTPYKGCKVKIYTYHSVKYKGCENEVQLNLLVYRNRIIGGDISEISLNGKMFPLTTE